MSTYKGSTPSLTIDPRIPEFFEKFYAVSDNPSEESHTEYANSMTKKATFVMGSKKVEGYDAILELRKGTYLLTPTVSSLGHARTKQQFC